MHEIIWKVSTEQFACGNNAYLGKWIVGSVFYDGVSSKSTKEKYKATCRLPGLKSNMGNFKTQDAAKAKVQQGVDFWFAGLQGRKDGN